ncbi:MAG: CapA family protein [Lachnospiraceae bacterium]|nr:CapA family protein [Lachnospiraceae bacterium]
MHISKITAIRFIFITILTLGSVLLCSCASHSTNNLKQNDSISENTDPFVSNNGIITSSSGPAYQTKDSLSSSIISQSSVNPVYSPSENETVQVPSDKTVRIMMVGDILLHTPVEDACRQEDGSYDFSNIFSNTDSIIRPADLALVNQEVIIGGEELGISGYPAFNAPAEISDALADAGFDVVCHATNHALDKGAKGIKNTLSTWREDHPEITTLGIYDNPNDSENIVIKEINGIKLALLNYTYGTNGIPLPSDMPYCVELLSKDNVINDLDYAEEHADFTIVCPHWGTEYRLKHNASQEKWCRLFIEHGADLVLGTHPHVISEIELYQEDDKEMLVYYSLGNFVNWTSGTGEGVSNRMVGGIADVELIKDENGDVSINDYGVIPIVCHVTSGKNGVTVYPLEDYTEALAGQNEIISQDPSFSLTYCRDLVNSIWGDTCCVR